MQLVPSDQLGQGRYYCAATGRTTDPEGMFDFRIPLTMINSSNRPEEMPYRSCVSVAAAKEMARTMGWHSPEDVKGLIDRLGEMSAALEAVKSRQDKIEAFRELEAELTEVGA